MKANGLKTYSAEEASAILDAAMNQSPSSAYAALQTALMTRINVIEEVLPDQMRGQAARLVKRAMLTFSRSDKLVRCTAASFVRCVLEAAEVGLAIDGKLGHAVPYKGEAQFQPDYKGLIAIAKRAGQIRDAYGDVVRANDHFKHGRSGGQSVLEHSYDLTCDRGEVIGAYAIIKLPDDWRAEVMDEPELVRIRNKSKAKDSGPWVTDTDQMRIKTVIKRALKLYCDDPGLIRAIELSDVEYEGSAPVIPQGRVQRSSLNDALSLPKPNGVRQPAHERIKRDEGVDHPAPDDINQDSPDSDPTEEQMQEADLISAIEEEARRLGCPEDKLQAVVTVAKGESDPQAFIQRQTWRPARGERGNPKPAGQLFNKTPSAQEA